MRKLHFLHNLDHVLVRQHVILPAPLRLVPDGRAPDPGIFNERHDAFVDSVAELLDGWACEGGGRVAATPRLRHGSSVGVGMVPDRLMGPNFARMGLLLVLAAAPTQSAARDPGPPTTADARRGAVAA